MTCTVDGCTKPYRARGLCSTHYNKANKKPVELTCAACGERVVKDQAYVRRVACSTRCRSYLQNGWPSTIVPITHASRMLLQCDVPYTHPVRSSRVPLSHPSRQGPPKIVARFHVGRCAECAAGYVIDSTCVSSSRYCSQTCARRTSRRARRAREHNAGGTFTWDAFAKLAQSLGSTCSYCAGDNGGQPLEPDHVVPLSRGGHNGLTNILPACRWCNGDKRDLLVHEWAIDRGRRGLPPRRYDIGRFVHLTAHAARYAA